MKFSPREGTERGIERGRGTLLRPVISPPKPQVIWSASSSLSLKAELLLTRLGENDVLLSSSRSLSLPSSLSNSHPLSSSLSHPLSHRLSSSSSLSLSSQSKEPFKSSPSLIELFDGNISVETSSLKETKTNSERKEDKEERKKKERERKSETKKEKAKEKEREREREAGQVAEPKTSGAEGIVKEKLRSKKQRVLTEIESFPKSSESKKTKTTKTENLSSLPSLHSPHSLQSPHSPHSPYYQLEDFQGIETFCRNSAGSSSHSLEITILKCFNANILSLVFFWSNGTSNHSISSKKLCTPSKSCNIWNCCCDRNLRIKISHNPPLGVLICLENDLIHPYYLPLNDEESMGWSTLEQILLSPAVKVIYHTQINKILNLIIYVEGSQFLLRSLQ